jgi:DNA-binding CsgD family transcriptional regulator/sugar-specific transcriptional regulator TrmB
MTSLAVAQPGNDYRPRPSPLTRSRLALAGLTPAEESVYITLLDLPPVTVSDARQACTAVNFAELHTILEALTDKGLLTECSEQAPRRYAPVAPQQALQAALDKQEEELRQTRATVEALSERYRAVPRPSTTDDLAEIVTGKQRTLHRWFTALGNATSQVRILCRPPFETDSAEPHPAELDMLGKGIPVRCVYDGSSLRSPAALARRKAEIAAGEQARVTGEVPLHLLLVDDNLALMPLGRDRLRSDGLLVVRPCALLDGLAALFELAWSTALPLSLDRGPSGQPPVLQNPTTRTILGLLAAGLSDQAIARRLGCSERTVQRHILRLSEAVGAKTRFQAALHIGRRNWTG